MNRNRLIFYLVFTAFHLAAFIFTLMLDGDTGLLFKMVNYVPMFKWMTLLGLLLLITDFIWYWKTQRDNARQNAVLLHELNTLKAKLFDLQEAAKKQTTENNPDNKK